MEKHCVLKIRIRDICIGEGIVRAGIVQEDPVDPGNGQNHGIGSGTVGIHDQAACVIMSKNFLNHTAEGIAADFSHQLHICSQDLQGQTGIGDTAAGMDICRIHMNQLSSLQKITDFLISGSCRKNGCNVNTDITCCNDFFPS